jgi:Rhodanese-related sulfurtransferase
MSYKTGAELTEEARAQIREVSPAEVKKMVEGKEEVVLLDVREPNEWNLGRIPGAVHLPRGNLESKLEGMIDRGRKIVVYCARGNRSALAALTMKQMGYEDVASMSGGFQTWPDVNGPVEG